MQTAICQYCNKDTKEPNINIEWNFAEGAVYFYCPECKKMNRLSLKKEAKPLPRSQRL